MDAVQRRKIEHMRAEGGSYANIADTLGLSINTVKSFCRRNIVGANGAAEQCIGCGCHIKQTPGAKKKRFCSDKCRMVWWNQHPEAVNRKAFYHLTCAHCSGDFDSYGNAKRKYCSRACFAADRRAADA